MKTENNKQSALSLYRLAVYLLGIPLVLYTLWQAMRFRDLRYFMQRLGFSYTVPGARTIWLHVASVGEARAAAPVIRLLLEKKTQSKVYVTTFTVTGAEVINKAFGGQVVHAYLPLDFPGATKRFIKTIKPGCALVMETEIWPNLFRTCEVHGVPVVLFNARLSAKTLGTNAWMKRVYAATLGKVATILARSDEDGARFVTLGADKDRVRTTGNIKFAYHPGQVDESVTGGINRPYILAASTHKDEEKQVIKAWLEQSNQDHLLVVAPRHPHRLNEILAQVDNMGVNIAVRSRGDTVTGQTQVYIADTIGELTSFMAGATLVYMGGSLVPVGGHNIIEPANYAKPILFGPHMDNFSEECRLFLQHDAALQVSDSAALAQAMDGLLADADRRAALGRHALELVSRYRDIDNVYLSEFEKICGCD